MEGGLLKNVVLGLIFFGGVHSGYGQQINDKDTKRTITPIENALDYIQQLKPKRIEYSSYRHPEVKKPGARQYGFLAEEVQKVLPELVSSQTKSYMVGKNQHQTTTVQKTDMESLIPILVAAIKEQQVQIEELNRQLKELKKQ